LDDQLNRSFRIFREVELNQNAMPPRGVVPYFL
jgi:hypothetical protein